MAGHTSDDDVRHFELTLDEEGDILVMRLIGDVDAQNIHPALTQAAALIRQPGKTWRMLTDFSRMRLKAHPSVIKTAGEFTRGNAPYIHRAAAIGLGSSARRFLYNRMVALSGRTNLRAFETRADAEAWLREGD